MSKLTTRAVLTMWLLTASQAAAAPLTIEFVMQPSLPEQFVVDVVVSGLPPGGPPSLGAFDLLIGFDPTSLSPLTVEFGPLLGDPASFEAITSVTVLPATIAVAEASLLLPSELDALQPASFTLATLAFELTGAPPPLVLLDSVFSDAFGDVIDGEAPEPALALLLAIAGLALWHHRRSAG
jgi:hypothetical protein